MFGLKDVNVPVLTGLLRAAIVLKGHICSLCLVVKDDQIFFYKENRMFFKSIFDLEPKDVENFIIELTKKQFHFDNAKEEEQFWNDFYLIVGWYPANNEFYVYTEPKLSYECKKIKFGKKVTKQFPHLKEIDSHYTFKGREISLDEYLYHQFNHYHYNFHEIYALMTGETEIWSVGYGSEEDDIELYYYGIYKKNYIDVIKTKTNEWFLQEWEDSDDEKAPKEIRNPIPEDLLKYVLKLEPKEVESR